jgi:hypothetical protein
VATTDDVIPLIVFSSMDRNDEPKVSSPVIMLARKHLIPTEPEKFCKNDFSG